MSDGTVVSARSRLRDARRRVQELGVPRYRKEGSRWTRVFSCGCEERWIPPHQWNRTVMCPQHTPAPASRPASA